jgi:hypothetical protein
MRQLVDRYIEAYNACDFDAMLALMERQVVFENFSQGVLTARAVGIAQLREMAEKSATLFRKRKQTVLTYVEAGDAATVDILFEGTLAANLPNGLKAGQSLSLYGLSEFRFANGLISGLRDFG